MTVADHILHRLAFFDGKVVITTLPVTSQYAAERRLFTDKGEMAQIANRAEERFVHLLYWDLKPGLDRGHHYHARKWESLYVIAGKLELHVKDNETGKVLTEILTAGMKVTIAPQCPHAFRALEYSQTLEFHTDPYDESDTSKAEL